MCCHPHARSGRPVPLNQPRRHTGVSGLINRIARSHMPAVYILLLSMLAQTVFELAGFEKVVEKTLALCYCLLFGWILTMAYAGLVFRAG
ncbi:hypothetical protein F5883DRAFT_568207 [Diaporthe sp. PMI_573]|nr:hypothetical protein F5883DRAFT_568207 [Diaporthaceae sp. PMI_573]